VGDDDRVGSKITILHPSRALQKIDINPVFGAENNVGYTYTQNLPMSFRENLILIRHILNQILKVVREMDFMSIIFSAVCGILTALGLVSAAATLNVVFGIINFLMLISLCFVIIGEINSKKKASPNNS
jgi:hypothetical protein